MFKKSEKNKSFNGIIFTKLAFGLHYQCKPHFTILIIIMHNRINPSYTASIKELPMNGLRIIKRKFNFNQMKNLITSQVFGVLYYRSTV